MCGAWNVFCVGTIIALRCTTNGLFNRTRQTEPSLVYWDIFLLYNEWTDCIDLCCLWLIEVLCLESFLIIDCVSQVLSDLWAPYAKGDEENGFQLYQNAALDTQYISAAVLFSVGSLYWLDDVISVVQVNLESSMMGKRLDDERAPARADRLQMFTLNPKNCQLQSGLKGKFVRSTDNGLRRKTETFATWSRPGLLFRFAGSR